jgi:glycosyltransferase involved in cell wall biosynthesis
MTGDLPAVALDVSVARFNRAGSGSYARWLAAGLRPLLGERLRCIELAGSDRRTAMTGWRRRAHALRHDLWWTQHGVTRAARRVGADLLHVPTILAPISSPVPLVVTIHDLSVLNFPERFPWWFRTWTAFTLPRVAVNAAVVITDSQASRDDVLRRWPGLESRIAVVRLGIPAREPSWNDPARLERLRREYRLDRPFALTVGTPEPRKNLPRLLRALRRLRAEPATRDIILVHAGPPGWLGDAVHVAVRDLGLADAVRFAGFVPDADLPALYAMARVTVYPSLFEGFGLPILEAMASGCPVVTSNVSSMPEVAGEAAILVDPANVDEIADAIRRLWLDDELRGRYRRAGLERSARFTIERMARETIAAYQRVSG